jgi:ADP-ribosylglycohydrolase
MRTAQTNLPNDHAKRMQRVLLSLDGLSVGDGFGECFFTGPDTIRRRLESRDPPPPRWIVTDDTIMALSIVRCLKRHGFMDQDILASAFAEEYARNPNRGYGGMAVQILAAISEGYSWKEASRRAFQGQGSCGNGGAMRAAPIGAYFADDLDRVIYEAKCSAEVTHAHPDGKTGAVAVALAAGWRAQPSGNSEGPSYDLIDFVSTHIPRTETYHQLLKVFDVPFETEPNEAARILGNGTRVMSQDTVPFCLWCAARHPNSYEDAMWATVSGLGDRDTTCAIVGGIVALSAGRESIPTAWLEAREPVQI